MKSLVVEKEKLTENIAKLSFAMGDVPICAVLKANGYGLGLEKFYRFLKAAGIKKFAVATVEEGIALRETGADDEILVLSSTSILSEATAIVKNNLTATIGSYDGAIMLNGIASEEHKKIKAHIKIDTGFGRFGFLPEETDKVIYINHYLENIELCGIFTHYSSAFLKKEEYVRRQYDLFMDVLSRLESAGVTFAIRHTANSSAALRFPYTRLDMVRMGSAFLGRLAFPNKLGLQKIGYMKGKISETKWLPTGHNVGYAEVFETKNPTKIAIINIGYSDGYGREKAKDTFRMRDIARYTVNDLSRLVKDSALYVTVHGKKCPVLGRVGLCNIVIDITKNDCNPGDTVIAEINPLLVDSMVEREYV